MTKQLKVTTNDDEWHPKYYSMFVGLFCGLYMITAAITPKIVEVGPFILSAGVIVFPLCAILTDLFTELYGFNRTRQAIWITLFCTILFALFTTIAIHLPAASFWQYQEGFIGIFELVPRLAVAGCLAWLTGEFSNSYIMSKMKVYQKAENPAIRFIGSTIVGQFADTSIIVLVGFSGTMPWVDLLNMGLTIWAFKVSYEIIALPLSLWVTRKIKNLEGVEHYDRQKISLI